VGTKKTKRKNEITLPSSVRKLLANLPEADVAVLQKAIDNLGDLLEGGDAGVGASMPRAEDIMLLATEATSGLTPEKMSLMLTGVAIAMRAAGSHLMTEASRVEEAVDLLGTRKKEKKS
jgi:hypothetical protein